MSEADIDQFCQSVENVITGIKYRRMKKNRSKKQKDKLSDIRPVNKAG